METAGDVHILLQDRENEMYKLTYDSDEENDEVNAKDVKVKQEVESTEDHSPSKEIKHMEEPMKDQSKDTALIKNKKRTKDHGRYEGNGRFYSLFANDNFVTDESPSKRKRKCGLGIKEVLMVLTIIILTAGILCLIIAMRSLHDEQIVMQKRIEVLEARVGLSAEGMTQTSDGSEVIPPTPSLEEAKGASLFVGPITSDCCSSNLNRIKVFQSILTQQAGNLGKLETKVRRYIRSSDVRFAEVLRKIADNSQGLQSAASKISSVKSSADEAINLANAAKNLALQTLKDSGVNPEQINAYLQTTQPAQSGEVVAFSVVHAMGKDHIVGHDRPPLEDEISSLSGVLYDIESGVSPAISFSRATVGDDSHIIPESGVFHVPTDGTYVFHMNLCVQGAEKTTVYLMRNGIPLRAMEISSPSGAFAPVNPLQSFHAPSEVRPPLPSLEYSDSQAPHPLLEAQYVSLEAPPLPSMDESKHAQPNHFSELVDLEAGDSLYLKLHSGKLVDYKYPAESDEGLTMACNKFSGFKI